MKMILKLILGGDVIVEHLLNLITLRKRAIATRAETKRHLAAYQNPSAELADLKAAYGQAQISIQGAYALKLD